MIWNEDPSEQKYDDLQTQYLLGDDMVVAPVFRRNHTEWTLYIPKVKSFYFCALYILNPGRGAFFSISSQNFGLIYLKKPLFRDLRGYWSL
jgi:hypothetical protein